jgi:hypothetical protein
MVLPDVQLEAMSALDALERVSSVAQPWMPAYVPENQQIEITREPENTMSSATLAAALRAWAGYLDHTGTDAARSQLKTLAEKLIYMLSPADKARMEAAMELMQRGMRPTRAA